MVNKKFSKKDDFISDLKGCIARMSPEQQKNILVEGKVILIKNFN